MSDKISEKDNQFLLSVKDLTICQKGTDTENSLLSGVSFTLRKNERLGIVGPSGSGKSLTLKAVLGILPENLYVKECTKIIFSGVASGKKVVSYIPQNPQLHLNPLISIGTQLGESIRVFDRFSKNKEIIESSFHWLERVGFDDPGRIYRAYPHELSGGQLQRAIIAMAISQQPSIILADEPSTALDLILQNQILDLLFKLSDSIESGVIMISHDLDLISKWTHKSIYLQNGTQITQFQPATSIRKSSKKNSDKGEVVLKVTDLSVSYKKGWFRPTYLKVLNKISFTLAEGESLGVIGVSGSGKSTLAKTLCGIISPDEGELFLHPKRPGGQLIFQNPLLSLNPKFNVRKTLTEAIKTQNKSIDFINTRISEVLGLVNLDESYLSQYPQECSGGEQQRIAIARALSVQPGFLILDESLASLDWENQISIGNMLLDLQARTRISILFISHDIKRVAELCDRIMVISGGTIVAIGTQQEILENKDSPLIEALFSHFPA
jgi:ABC-type glutathione transport system ATPase component